MSPFASFRMGVTLALLNADGTNPVDSDLLKISAKEGARSAAKHFNRDGDMPSGPGGFWGSRPCSGLHTVSAEVSVNSHRSSDCHGPNGKV